LGNWKIDPAAGLYFITTTIVEWQYIFTSNPYFEILINSLKYCLEKKKLHLHGFVMMPNHAHYIVSVEQDKHLSDVMRDFNTRTSREITRLLKEEQRSQGLLIFREAAKREGRGNQFKVWQEGFHPIAIETGKFFFQKLNYLHNNPVRKGFVEKPEHWRHSSARNYFLGGHSVIEVECLL
jgi:REP element-mobilizing transposase RayT